MNLIAVLQDRFRSALKELTDSSPDVNIDSLVQMIKRAQDPRHGDYQVNCAMSLGKQLSKSPRDVATELVSKLDLSDICDEPEVAGPGFINLRLKDEALAKRLEAIRTDEQLGIEKTSSPRTYIVDFSSPNVAKPMHVGHIRSTVIGDSLCRTLRFLGHNVISDNHLGDWGTQFGMIIYGYRNFADVSAYEADPIQELSRVYRVVRAIQSYHETKANLPKQTTALEELKKKLSIAESQEPSGDAKADKKAAKALKKLAGDVTRQEKAITSLEEKIAATESSPEELARANEHADIGQAVLQETAKLHEGDAENKKLWNEFVPRCRGEIDDIYQRLDIQFDQELGESFYHDQLAGVVDTLKSKGMARESDGAMCVFLDEFAAPMIVQKRDGAFLYATTDLATIQYRVDHWKPDAVLYVVDFRQSEHFEKLFAVAKAWGFEDVEFSHVSFGTVLGPDGKPLKTREGTLISLESLLNEAVARAHKVVNENSPHLPEDQRKQIASVVGHSAVKYADLSQARNSDYRFDFDKMVATQGDTSTYLQYSYARIQSIFAKGEVDVEALRSGNAKILLNSPEERNLAIQLLQFEEAIHDVLVDYRPNFLTEYLFQLAKRFAQFFAECPVLKSEGELKQSRLLLCDIVARTMKCGLSLLGIQVIDKM